MANPRESWLSGKPRNAPKNRSGVHAHEIEPGRPVPNNWDRALFETWDERKARLARERGAALG